MVIWMRHVKRLVKIGIFMFILSIVFVIGVYVFAYFTEPIALNTANSYYIYDNKDNVIYQGSNNSEWVSLDNIDEEFLDFIVNVEDRHFYNHFGFDIVRIIKSFYLNAKAGKIVGGGSSISQQYVKNLFLEFDQTWERKIEEAFLTVRLETHYSKKEILEGYLNTIYFGQGIYGVKDAAQYYFNKDISDITTEEAITLAGIPKSPNNYNPISNRESFLKRTSIVANFLKDNDIITNDEFNNLDFYNMNVYGKHQNHNLDTLMYYQDSVLAELKSIKSIPKSLLSDGGLRIFTNLDLDTQTAMENSMKENEQNDDNQIAGVVVNPNTGGVIALAGGKSYIKSQYNRVTQAKRQVGSTIKPFLYYAALNNGMTAASTFKSEKTSFVFGENKTYSPTNYGDTYGNKDITMAAALSYSDNIYAVKTHLFLGEETLVNTLKTCGLKEELSPNPSLALGAKEINMLDFATAYSTLASGGIKHDAFFIRRVEDINGNKIYEKEVTEERVLDESITYIVNELMRNTYNYNFVDYYSPTVLYLNGKLSHKYAIKSGTTDNDYWLCGYNKEALMLIWAGNDENKETPKTYSKLIKNIWLATMESHLENTDEDWYTKPENVVAVPMNPISGKYDAKSKSLLYFLSGTELAYIK